MRCFRPLRRSRYDATHVRGSQGSGTQASQGAHRRAVEAAEGLPIVEVTGKAGDVLLVHPQTFHGSSNHLGDGVRLASNMCIALHEKKDLARADAEDYSPVEYATVHALREVPA